MELIFLVTMGYIFAVLIQKYHKLRSKVDHYEKVLLIKEREKAYIPSLKELLEVYNDNTGLRQLAKVITKLVNMLITLVVNHDRIWVKGKLKFREEL